MAFRFTQWFFGEDSPLKKIIEHILGCSRKIWLPLLTHTKKGQPFNARKKFAASMESSVIFTVGGCYPKKSPDTVEQNNIKFINRF